MSSAARVQLGALKVPVPAPVRLKSTVPAGLDLVPAVDVVDGDRAQRALVDGHAGREQSRSSRWSRLVTVMCEVSLLEAWSAELASS